MAARMMLLTLAAALAAPAALALPDPTALPVQRGAGQPADRPVMSLTAIKISGKQKIAVIDGKEVAVGGQYQGAHVVRINENEVVLRRGRETTVLRFDTQVEKRLRAK